MHKSNHHSIRMLLQQHHDGLTVSELAERSGKDRASITNALKGMPDVYIDRWISCRQWAAVWCVVVPPENCPRPKPKMEKHNDRTRTKPTRLSSDVCYGGTIST